MPIFQIPLRVSVCSQSNGSARRPLRRAGFNSPHKERGSDCPVLPRRRQPSGPRDFGEPLAGRSKMGVADQHLTNNASRSQKDRSPIGPLIPHCSFAGFQQAANSPPAPTAPRPPPPNRSPRPHSDPWRASTGSSADSPPSPPCSRPAPPSAPPTRPPNRSKG